ncbi:hypothetical protein DFS34DRAFT_645476 [Phlyctochytrium arcticum]|nr:hypothetical protein DFS34DRAFT_645476 [Phlyctochytrium arcticum]
MYYVLPDEHDLFSALAAKDYEDQISRRQAQQYAYDQLQAGRRRRQLQQQQAAYEHALYQQERACELERRRTLARQQAAARYHQAMEEERLRRQAAPEEEERLYREWAIRQRAAAAAAAAEEEAQRRRRQAAAAQMMYELMEREKAEEAARRQQEREWHRYCDDIPAWQLRFGTAGDSDSDSEEEELPIPVPEKSRAPTPVKKPDVKGKGKAVATEDKTIPAPRHSSRREIPIEFIRSALEQTAVSPETQEPQPKVAAQQQPPKPDPVDTFRRAHAARTLQKHYRNTLPKLRNLASILSDLRKAQHTLEPACMSTPLQITNNQFLPYENKPFVAYEEALIALLIRADAIESGGVKAVRERRRHVVLAVNTVLGHLDAMRRDAFRRARESEEAEKMDVDQPAQQQQQQQEEAATPVVPEPASADKSQVESQQVAPVEQDTPSDMVIDSNTTPEPSPAPAPATVSEPESAPTTTDSDQSQESLAMETEAASTSQDQVPQEPSRQEELQPESQSELQREAQPEAQPESKPKSQQETLPAEAEQDAMELSHSYHPDQTPDKNDATVSSTDSRSPEAINNISPDTTEASHDERMHIDSDDLPSSPTHSSSSFTFVEHPSSPPSSPSSKASSSSTVTCGPLTVESSPCAPVAAAS